MGKPKSNKCKKCPCGMTGSVTIITETGETEIQHAVVQPTGPPPCRVYRGPPPGHPGYMPEENTVGPRQNTGRSRYHCGHCNTAGSSKCVIQ